MFKNFKNKKSFSQTKAAKSDEEIICATLVDDRPVYFAMPKDATEVEVREKAFEIRTGRAMSKVEQALAGIVEVQKS